MPVLDRMIGFLITANVEKAVAFYQGVLGFRLLGQDEYALVFDANGTMLRINKAKQHEPAQGTVLGWEVDDVHAAIAELGPRGVKFEQFDLPFMKQDAEGVWATPAGDCVAWFRDADRNVLSISSHPGRPGRD